MSDRQITIDPRFRGPVDSGTGGYVCGILAQHLSGPAVVRLSKPPPLDTPMDVRDSERGLELWAGDDLVASAWINDVSFDVPDPPTPEEVEHSRPRYLEPEYRYPTGCFVCGPERDFGDGMRVFPGLVAGRSMVAATWLPDESLADDSGLVEPHFVWSALDCPGAFSFEPDPGHLVNFKDSRLGDSLMRLITIEDVLIKVDEELARVDAANERNDRSARTSPQAAGRGAGGAG